MCRCIPDRIGIWKCRFLRRGENRSTQRKTSRSKGENQQQTQPTYGINALATTPPLPPPLPPLLTNIIEKKGHYQKCNSNVFAVSRHFCPLGNYITFLG